jgi:hypothetical protein
MTTPTDQKLLHVAILKAVTLRSGGYLTSEFQAVLGLRGTAVPT